MTARRGVGHAERQPDGAYDVPLQPMRTKAERLEFWGVSGNSFPSRVSLVRVSGVAPVRRNSSPLRAKRGGLSLSGFRVGAFRFGHAREPRLQVVGKNERPASHLPGSEFVFGDCVVDRTFSEARYVANAMYRVGDRFLLVHPFLHVRPLGNEGSSTDVGCRFRLSKSQLVSFFDHPLRSCQKVLLRIG